MLAISKQVNRENTCAAELIQKVAKSFLPLVKVLFLFRQREEKTAIKFFFKKKKHTLLYSLQNMIQIIYRKINTKKRKNNSNLQNAKKAIERTLRRNGQLKLISAYLSDWVGKNKLLLGRAFSGVFRVKDAKTWKGMESSLRYVTS